MARSASSYREAVMCAAAMVFVMGVVVLQGAHGLQTGLALARGKNATIHVVGSSPGNRKLLGAAVVIAYEHCDYQGTGWAFPSSGEWDSRSFPNDQFSSFRVASGYTVTLYEHGDGSGRTYSFTSDIPCLWHFDFNDLTSRVRISSGGGNGPAPSPGGGNSIRNAVLQATNTFRAQNGLRSLVLDDKLNNACQKHAADMKRHNRMTHEGSDGSGIAERANREGFQGWSLLAENVAVGQRSAQEVVTAWINSPGHRANLLGNFKYLGVGAETDGWWWCQMFANTF